MTPGQRATANQVAQNGVPLSELAPNAPDSHTVKRGDTLYVVAKRFNVEMQHLKRWNPGAGKALKPGQMLTVYQPH